MTTLTCDLARAVLDAISLRFEGKQKASAATFQAKPFAECASPDWWADTVEREIGLSQRTLAYLVGYAMISGGRIPLVGLELADGYFRPDQYVIRSLLAHGLVAVDGKSQPTFQLTSAGWQTIATHLSEVPE